MMGDAKVLMFVNVTALEDYAQESLSSLNFAKKVNSTRVNQKKAGLDELKHNNMEWSALPDTVLQSKIKQEP